MVLRQSLLPGVIAHLLLLLLSLAYHAPALGQVGSNAPPFSLTDQFGNTTTLRFPQPAPVVLLFAGRSGRAEARQWAAALGGPSSGTRPVRLVSVACTGWVPGLFQAQVRRGFAQASPILIDWNDAVAKQYGWAGSGCRVVAINAAGRIVAVSDEAFSATRFAAFTQTFH